jgi:serine/threonine protein kinase/formylglycine-generating enzyme required for sulfatase activity
MKRIDKYEILAEIGRGGMGVIYQALHPHFKKYVAIKEIRADLANDPEMQQRFEREAELLARLPAHPNIVTVRDALVWEGQLYLVSDFIEGQTLGEVVKQGGIDARRGGLLLDQILSGLEAIHRCGIIHRDLKANNILIDREGTAYITDFGIAELIRNDPRTANLVTARGAAPEMLDSSLGRGGTAPQADIYGAGMLAYEMLLGENRFRQAFPEIYHPSPEGARERWLLWHTDLARAATNLHQLDPEIPKPLASVVERMMAKNVSERYREVADARRDLAAAMRQPPASRGDRMEPYSDDATVPLDKLPGQSVKETALLEPQPLRQGPGKSPEPRIASRRVAPWVWWASGGALLLALLAVLLFVVLPKDPGFTLVVRGVLPNTEVYVGELRRGIPAVASLPDGSPISVMRVYGLKAGERYDVRVSHQGNAAQLFYPDTKPVNEKVTGEDGQEIVITAKLDAVSKKPEAAEIDYKGPMIFIPAGKFIMGDNDGRPEERPAHEVSVEAFYIDKFEVTNAQYKEFCRATGASLPAQPIGWGDALYFESNPNAPVMGVSWNDAKAYAAWIGKRLPSEAEWEKAASWSREAEDLSPRWKRRWPWGNDPAQNRASLGLARPVPVADYQEDVSAYGVRGMAGNVGEWVEDFFRPFPFVGNQAGGANLEGGPRVVRGGNFKQPVDAARTTRRDKYPADAKMGASVPGGTLQLWVGFRCAVSANDNQLQAHLAQKGSVGR